MPEGIEPHPSPMNKDYRFSGTGMEVVYEKMPCFDKL
jgi:hypothetical protein